MWLDTGTQLVIGTSCVPVSALASRFGTMRMESPKLRYAEPNGLREHITRTGVSDLVFTYWGVRLGFWFFSVQSLASTSSTGEVPRRQPLQRKTELVQSLPQPSAVVP